MSLQLFVYSLTASNCPIIILVRKGVILPGIIMSSFYYNLQCHLCVGEKKLQSRIKEH